MTEQERLEEIEGIIEEFIPYICTGAEMNMGILEDVYTSIDKEVKWLIKYAKEQAERVEESEKEIKRLEKFIDNLQVVHFTELQTEKAENARYKQALEEIREADSHNKFWKYIAIKALRGESND